MQRTEPRWLTVAEVIEVNQDEVADTGEPFLVRDQGLLESACARPRHIWEYHENENDVVRITAALIFGISKNHPFTQGNKRTAFVAGLLFLELNGYTYVGADEPEYWGKLVIDLQDQKISEAAFAEMLREHLRPLEGAITP